MATRRKTLGPTNLGRGGLLTNYRPPATPRRRRWARRTSAAAGC
jgi:hypothetical protein